MGLLKHVILPLYSLYKALIIEDIIDMSPDPEIRGVSLRDMANIRYVVL